MRELSLRAVLRTCTQERLLLLSADYNLLCLSHNLILLFQGRFIEELHRYCFNCFYGCRLIWGDIIILVSKEFISYRMKTYWYSPWFIIWVLLNEICRWTRYKIYRGLQFCFNLCLQSLVQVITTSEDFVSMRATIVLGELLHMVGRILNDIPSFLNI